MMYIHFLVIKGACIKIPAIKDDFLFENITLLLQQLLPQTDFVDAIGPIVQIENIGVRMMGGNLIIVFNVPFKPMDIITTPSA